MSSILDYNYYFIYCNSPSLFSFNYLIFKVKVSILSYILITALFSSLILQASALSN